MHMNIEGIVIHKTPYKERDLICNLLLRSGKTLSVYFYGGQGGGKSQKGSILDLGAMVTVTLAPRKKKLETEVQIAKEYNLIWASRKIRDDFQAFYLSTFYFEYLGKIAISENIDDVHATDHEGLFNVLSNALFYLDSSVSKGEFNLHVQLFMFLSKLTVQLGINPDTDSCLFCATDLEKQNMFAFDAQNGGFICADCLSKQGETVSENVTLQYEYQNSVLLRRTLKNALHLPFKDYALLSGMTQGLTAAEFQYINYQLGFTPDQFNTWKMINI